MTSPVAPCRRRCPWSVLLLAIVLSVPMVAAADPLVVYSARKEHLIEPLFKAYTTNTGIEIRYITDKAGPLLARLKAEGERTPADLLMTVDAGNLWHAASSGMLAPIASDTLNQHVPAHLRDPGGHWFGLSIRARTLVYSTERVKPGELSTYEALAGPVWKGRLCLRTSKKVYNQSLVAMLIARLGEARAEEIIRGWVDNLATDPFANDTRMMEAIAAGRCDVGIGNTYYFGRLQKQTPTLPLALFWPNQQDGAAGGVHVNVSGAGITRHAPQPEAARKLLEWLVSPEAQKLLADMNMEYPVREEVALAPEVAAWGPFSADPRNLAAAGELQARAVMLMDRAGYR